MNIAFLGFGEAGQAFAAGWAGRDALRFSAYDIKTDHADPAVRQGKRDDYARHDLVGADTPREAVAEAELVVSLVTADQALNAARAAAAHLRSGTLYFDGNSCAPDTKRAAAAAIDGAGGCYVDMAVMAAVHPALHRVAVLLGGPHAEAAMEVAGTLDMNARPVPGDVGTASSIKMVRSIMMKGLEALVCECVLAGRRAGVDQEVLDSLEKTYPGFGWTERSAYMFERVMTHGLRRAAEMREVAKTVDDLGLAGGMARATVDWHQRIGALGLDATAIGETDYARLADAVLKDLGIGD